MRKIYLSLLLMAAAGTAQGADLDYDYLRGADYDPPPTALVDWSGVYVGGHGGYTSGSFAQRNAAQSALANYFNSRDIEAQYSVSTLVSFPGSKGRGASYGAFAGYNLQFDDVVVGLEADYTHSNQRTQSTYGIGRTMTTTGGMYETVNFNGVSKTEIEDYGTIRARAGYAVGSFLPFVTAGLAIGQVRFNDSVAVQNFGYNSGTYTANQALTTGQSVAVTNHGYASFNQNYPQPYSTPAGGGVQTVPAAATNVVANDRVKTVGGVALGFGLEYALTQNILLRGEYQYVNFQSFNGHNAELNTVRGGAAVKF
jgi:opacity protein-like surface antigen